MYKNNNFITNFNFIVFISTTTFFLILYLFQKNNYIEFWKKKNILEKELLFYSTQVNSKEGRIVGLKRADRIRNIAMQHLDMYIVEPESLIIKINE